MPILKFEVQADYEKVIKLREEISKLESTLKGMDIHTPAQEVQKIEARLSQASKEFEELTSAAALSGSVIEGNFKKKIYDASQSVNELTGKIIEQKENIRLATRTAKEYAEKYREALKGGQPGEASYYKKMAEEAKQALEVERTVMFELTQEQAKARLSVKALTDEYKLLKKEAGDVDDVLAQVKHELVGMGKNVLGAIGLGMGVKEFVSQMANVRGEFQQIETSLEVLLGNKEKANKLMEDVKEFAKVSPLDLKSTAAATQMMLGFNIEAEKVPRYLQAIGDISMGDATRFNSLTLAFSQMSATGKLMGQDLNQMINAGFNPLQAIADKTGKSISTLKEEMSKGAISAQMVQDAFVSATDAGGKFYQMSEKASQTINGQVSMLRDAMDAMFNELGESNEGLLLAGIRTATSLVENYETVGAVIGGLIATYGTYKTAVMVNIALTEGWAAAAKKDALAKGIQTAATKTATIAQAAYNAVANANPYVLLATAVIAAASAIVIYSTRADKATETQKRLNKAISEADAAIASEQTNIDLLFNRLRNAKEGTEEFAAAQKAIVDQYGNYLTGLVDEKNSLLDVAEAYQRVTAAAKESAKARAMGSYSKEVNDEYYESYKKSMATIQKEIDGKVKNDKLRANLMDLVRRDIDGDGKLSEATMTALALAAKENGRADNTLVGKVRAEAKNIKGATGKRDRDLQLINERFGTFSNEYESLSLSQLQKLKADLAYQVKGLKSEKELEEVFLSFGNGTLKGFSNLAELRTTQLKIEDAIKQRKKEADETEKNKYSTQKEAAKKELEEAKKELKKVESDKGSTTKQYEAAKQRVSAAETKYKNLGGDTTGKEAKTAIKAQKDANKAADDALSLQRKRQQAEIDLMANGTEKKIAQINLDYEKQKDAINKQERELKQNNKGSLSEEQSKAIAIQHDANEAIRDKSLQDMYKEEIAAMRDYLKEYGTYQQQKLAIAEEYAEKIRKAQSEGERLSLAKERDKAIRGVEMNAINQQIDWQAVFGSFTGALESQLRETLSGLKEYVKTDKFKSSSAEDKKLVYEAIERIQQQLPGENQGTLNFGKLKEQMDALGVAINQAQEAYKVDVVAQNNLASAQEKYNEALKSGDKATIEAAKTNLTIAKTAADASAQAYVSATDNLQSLGAEVSESTKGTADGLNMVASGLQGFASGTLSGAFAGLQNTLTGLSKLDLGEKLNKAVGGLSEALSSAGVVGQIIAAVLSILDILKEGIGTLIASLIDTVLGAVSGILDNILSGDFVVQIGKSLKDGIGGILNTITFGGLNSWLSSSNAKWVAETTERLTARNEILCQSIDALKEEMSKAKGMKTVQAYDEAYKAQQELIKNTGGVLAAQMSYHGAHHSNSYYIDKAMTAADWKQITALVGQKVASSGDLWNLTPEQLKKLQGNPELWTKIYTSGKYDKTEYLDQYLALAESLDELTDSLKETLTQISFDSMYDSFVDDLMKMDAKAEDIAANVSEYFMRAMLNNKIGDAYAGRLEDWYNKFADSMRNDGTLDAGEIKTLNDEYMAMVNEAMTLRDQIAAATGYDKTSSAYQQGATGGYTTQLSEDTGSEIVGRATALLDAVYRLEALDVERNQSLDNLANPEDVALAQLTNSLLAGLIKQEADNYSVHVDVRRILVECYLEIQQIRENTGAIIKPINSMKESLEKIEKNTKDLI